MALAMVSVTNAHMKMATPVPYGISSLNNSPLDASGSDFPCKQRPGVYDAPASKNIMPIGAPQTLSFNGSATHGGGSCQISLTKDLKPTKNSKWMVIHSIEGGCPASAAGNIGNSPDGHDATQFKYSIPSGIAPADYTLAWTWFNKVGNREMYMNCAPVTVTAGSGKRDLDHELCNVTEEHTSEELFTRDTSFPDMFKANIGNGCTTVEATDVVFPNPGSSVQKGPGLSTSDKTLTGNCGSSASSGAAASPSSGASSNASPGASSGASGASSAPSAAAGSSGAPSSGSGSGASSAAGASPAAPSIVAIPPPGADSGSAKGSVAAPSAAAGAGQVAPASASGTAGSSGSSSGSEGSSTGSAASPAGSGAAASSPSTSASTGSSGGSAGASSSTPCSSPGQLVCSPDGTKFGTCDTNKMAVMMAVASGTKCSGGAITMAKRSARFARVYVA
ncbi:MAG: hypothetical protein Q9222_004581 [Ikaeria aurantiellina]